MKTFLPYLLGEVAPDYLQSKEPNNPIKAKLTGVHLVLPPIFAEEHLSPERLSKDISLHVSLNDSMLTDM